MLGARWQAAVVVFLLAGLAAQERSVTIQNLSRNRRAEWFTAVVPFAMGEVPRVPELHVEDRATVWEPFGARWPDGSVRQALCMFRAELPAKATARLALQQGRGPEVAEPEIAPLAAQLAVAVWQGDHVARAQPRLVAMLEQNAARQVALLRTRIGDTGLVFELIVETYAGQEHAWADLALFFSDPTTQAMQCHVDKVVVDCAGAALLLRHAGLLATDTKIVEGGTRVTLLEKQTLADGQGIRRTGALVPRLRGDGSLRDETILAAAVSPPLAATDWRGTAAWGPFGHVPDPPAAVAAGRGPGGRGGDPFAHFRFGLAKQAGQTGDQEDFGVAKLGAVAGTGEPAMLLDVEPSVLQEACRPVHFFEKSGAPVQAHDHPEWVVWSGRTHWHCEVSKDRLGKPCPEPGFDAHGWTGKDRQHWSSLYLTGWTLLTGKHWARREVENEVQIWLASQTIDPRFTTSGTGAPRGAGRSLLTACWLYQCTGDPDLRARMEARVDRVHAAQWAGKDVPEGKVRTFQVQGPDARMLAGKTRYWTPWQDSLAAIGFAAVARTTGNARAQAIADALALTCLRHGWRVGERDVPMIATAIRWKEGGEPLTAEERRDPESVLWSHGTAFSTWSIGAVELARQAAERNGDEPLAARARHILEALRRARPGGGRDGAVDRFAEWDAVR